MVASPILHCLIPFFFTLGWAWKQRGGQNPGTDQPILITKGCIAFPNTIIIARRNQSVHPSMCSTTNLRTTSSALSDSASSRKKTCCSPSSSVYTTSFPHSPIRAAYSLFRSRRMSRPVRRPRAREAPPRRAPAARPG
jgi:hypothetical protein